MATPVHAQVRDSEIETLRAELRAAQATIGRLENRLAEVERRQPRADSAAAASSGATTMAQATMPATAPVAPPDGADAAVDLADLPRAGAAAGLEAPGASTASWSLAPPGPIDQPLRPMRDGRAAAFPVFGRTDRWFRGKDQSGAARVQIPEKFWKIVVVLNGEDFEAYGFLLGQDIAAVTEAEFYVTDEWKAAWTPIRKVGEQMRGWLDLDAFATVDKHPDA